MKCCECSTHASDSVTFIRVIIRDKSVNRTLVCCNVISVEWIVIVYWRVYYRLLLKKTNVICNKVFRFLTKYLNVWKYRSLFSKYYFKFSFLCESWKSHWNVTSNEITHYTKKKSYALQNTLIMFLYLVTLKKHLRRVNSPDVWVYLILCNIGTSKMRRPWPNFVRCCTKRILNDSI